jgi:hypothetical protein
MSGQGYHFALDQEQADALLACADEMAVLDITERLVEAFVPGEFGCGGDKAWDVLHRCLGDGTFRPGGGTAPLNCPFLGGRLLVSEGSLVNLVTAGLVREVAVALAALDATWLCRRLDQRFGAEYGGTVPEEDAERFLGMLEELTRFYRQAASEGKAVVFVTDDGLECFRDLTSNAGEDLA